MAFPETINVSINGETAEYLVADHPVKSIDAVYVDGVKQAGEHSQRDATRVRDALEVTAMIEQFMATIDDDPERQGVPPASLHHVMQVWTNTGGGGWTQCSGATFFKLPETEVSVTTVVDRGEGLKRRIATVMDRKVGLKHGEHYRVGIGDTLHLSLAQTPDKRDATRAEELLGFSDSRILGSFWVDRKCPGGCRCIRYERGLAPVYVLAPAYYTGPKVRTWGLYVVPRFTGVEYLFLVGEEPGEITL